VNRSGHVQTRQASSRETEVCRVALSRGGKGIRNIGREDEVLPGQQPPQVSGEDSGTSDVRK